MELAQKSVGELKLTCRYRNPSDIKALDALLAEENWDTTENDIILAYQIHPKAFIGAFDANGKLISCVGTFTWTDSLAYLGTYLTHPDYRRRGIGRWLFEMVMARTGQKTVMLDSVSWRQNMYESRGFRTNFQLTQMIGKVDVSTLDASRLLKKWSQKNEDVKITEISTTTLGAVLDYDITLSEAERSSFLRALFGSDVSFSRCAVSTNTGRCCGYVIIRPSRNSAFAIAGLYADDNSIAGRLLYDVVSAHLPESATLLSYSPKINDGMVSLFDEFNILPGPAEANAVRMTHGKDIELNYNKVFSVMISFYFL